MTVTQWLTRKSGWLLCGRDFRCCLFSETYCGGYSGEDPPLPIPNREVKLTIADGTAPPGGRVGSCHFLIRHPVIIRWRGVLFIYSLFRTCKIILLQLLKNYLDSEVTQTFDEIWSKQCFWWKVDLADLCKDCKFIISDISKQWCYAVKSFLFKNRNCPVFTSFL